MADNEPAPDQEQAIEVESGSSGTNKAVIFLIILSVLVLLLTPAITILAIRALAPKKTDEATDAIKKQILEIKLEKLNANVADTHGSRYVRLDVVIEVNRADMQKYFEDKSSTNPEGMKSRMKAEILKIISSKNLEGLLSPEAKKRLSDEIKLALNEILRNRTKTDGMVVDVFFPSFLVQ